MLSKSLKTLTFLTNFWNREMVSEFRVALIVGTPLTQEMATRLECDEDFDSDLISDTKLRIFPVANYVDVEKFRLNILSARKLMSSSKIQMNLPNPSIYFVSLIFKKVYHENLFY